MHRLRMALTVVEICNTNACGLCCKDTVLGIEVCSPCCCKVKVDE